MTSSKLTTLFFYYALDKSNFFHQEKKLYLF